MRRLHLNESPYPPSPKVISAVTRAAADINRYPAGAEDELLAALADYCDVTSERLLLGNGSNELLHLLPLFSGALGGRDELIVPAPTFPTYAKVAGFYGIAVQEVPVTVSGCADVEAMLAAITPATRLICVASPNNPTGGMLSGTEIARLASGIPEGVLLHFDEAYYEFGRAAGGVETLALLQESSVDWLATRSFSKAFGLAGLRLGYGIASSATLAAKWRGLRPNFNVGTVPAAAGVAALQDGAYGATLVEKISAEREALAADLKRLGLSPFPSAANFVSLPTRGLGADPAGRLKEQDILAGEFVAHGSRGLRLTVGTREDSVAVMTALASMRVH